MLSKKLLQIYDCCFNLPDDFCGTCGEALMLLAQYRLEQERQNKIQYHAKLPYKNAYETCIRQNDTKAVISYQIYELQDNGTWNATVRKEKDNT